MPTKGNITGPKRSKKAKAPDKRPARIRYTNSHRWETNKVVKLMRHWRQSLAKYQQGPRLCRSSSGVVRMRRRRLDLRAALALEALTGRLPVEAKSFLGR